MEPTAATPTVAIIDRDERAVALSRAVLEAAGYVVGWFRQPWGLLDAIMNDCPTVVIIAGSRAERFDRWPAVQALHEMGCAVILATNDPAARRELFATPRGRCAVDAVRVPYDPPVVLAAVARAVQRYPANLWAGAVAAVAASREMACQAHIA
jgi:DNA-binding NtrC family response regulator